MTKYFVKNAVLAGVAALVVAMPQGALAAPFIIDDFNVNEGHFGSMVSYHNYQVRHVPIAEAVNRLKLVPPNGELVQTARDVDISFGD